MFVEFEKDPGLLFALELREGGVMPSMAPLSGGNKDGNGSGRGRGVPFGGRFGPPASPSGVDAAGKRKAATGLPETRVSKYEFCLLWKFFGNNMAFGSV